MTRNARWGALPGAEGSGSQRRRESSSGFNTSSTTGPPHHFFLARAERSTISASAGGRGRGGEGLCALAGRLKAQGHTVSLLHLLDPHELTFPFDELSLFEGLEGEEALKLDPEGVRSAYLAEMSAFCEGLRRRLLSQGVRYARCPTDLPLERALSLLTGREGGAA